MLERELKSPTLNKLADICEVLNVHPVTLLVLAYSGGTPTGEQSVLNQVLDELRELRELRDPPIA